MIPSDKPDTIPESMKHTIQIITEASLQIQDFSFLKERNGSFLEIVISL